MQQETFHPHSLTIETAHQLSQCANCNFQPLVQDFRFCPACGQSTPPHRITFHHVWHESIHAVTHADKGIFHLIKDLVLQPGKVLSAYILEGKRKKYFNPFTFILIMAGLLLVSTAIFKPYPQRSIQGKQPPTNNKIPDSTHATASANKVAQQKFNSNTGTSANATVGENVGAVTSGTAGENEGVAVEERAQRGKEMRERAEKLNLFMEKNSKMIVLSSVPISALVFFIAFRRRGLNYTEHLVAMLFLTGLLALVMALLTNPLMALVKNTQWYYAITVGLLLFQLVYMAVAYRVLLNNTLDAHPFFGIKSRKTNRVGLIHTLLVSLVNIIAWTVLSVGAGMVYIYAPFL